MGEVMNWNLGNSTIIIIKDSRNVVIDYPSHDTSQSLCSVCLHEPLLGE